MELISLDWSQVADSLVRIFVSFLLALPIGWERGKGHGSLGFRTFPIVAMGACGYALVANGLPGATAETQARLLQGLLAGIGFIGGGAIIKEGHSVHGLATAASIWNTGAIGAAVASDRVEIAIVLAAINFLALFLLTPPHS
jgi:putative Mg2+ transporter-C (MgtC) family protein